MARLLIDQGQNMAVIKYIESEQKALAGDRAEFSKLNLNLDWKITISGSGGQGYTAYLDYADVPVVESRVVYLFKMYYGLDTKTFYVGNPTEVDAIPVVSMVDVYRGVFGTAMPDDVNERVLRFKAAWDKKILYPETNRKLAVNDGVPYLRLFLREVELELTEEGKTERFYLFTVAMFKIASRFSGFGNRHREERPVGLRNIQSNTAQPSLLDFDYAPTYRVMDGDDRESWEYQLHSYSLDPAHVYTVSGGSEREGHLIEIAAALQAGSASRFSKNQDLDFKDAVDKYGKGFTTTEKVDAVYRAPGLFGNLYFDKDLKLKRGAVWTAMLRVARRIGGEG